MSKYSVDQVRSYPPVEPITQEQARAILFAGLQGVQGKDRLTDWEE